jgi:hypothetical protein
MQSNQRSFVASADVDPSVFVKISGVHSVATAGAGEAVYGVTQEWTREAPIPGVTPKAALAGEPVTVYGPGDQCEVLAGEAINAGAFVKSNSAGKAVAVGTGAMYYAQAVNTVTAANQKLKVTLVRGWVPAS